MMDFSPRHSSGNRGENIVPMIKVVFLLLMFFMMSAQISAPDPFEVTLPDSDSTSATIEDDTLYVSKEGTLSYEGLTGDALWNSLASRGTDAPLTLRADSALGADELAALLPKLSNAGVSEVLLATGRK